LLFSVGPKTPLADVSFIKNEITIMSKKKSFLWISFCLEIRIRVLIDYMHSAIWSFILLAVYNVLLLLSIIMNFDYHKQCSTTYTSSSLLTFTILMNQRVLW
jgi:hypothetical protein